MSVEEELRRLADNAAQQAQHRAATLEQEALELEEEIARKRAASELARNAFKRLTNFRYYGAKEATPVFEGAAHL